MNTLNSAEDRMRFINQEFQKIDDFYNDFKFEFEGEIVRIIRQYHPGFARNESFNEMLGQYATVLLSATTSILDKDQMYPKYRKIEEITSLQVYFDRISKSQEGVDFGESTLTKTKELLVKHNPKIFDLLPEGFRLLDIYLKLFHADFVANFNRELK
jgi:hypothetical protein